MEAGVLGRFTTSRMDRTAKSTESLDPRLYQALSCGIRSARALPYEGGDRLWCFPCWPGVGLGGGWSQCRGQGVVIGKSERCRNGGAGDGRVLLKLGCHSEPESEDRKTHAIVLFSTLL